MAQRQISWAKAFVGLQYFSALVLNKATIKTQIFQNACSISIVENSTSSFGIYIWFLYPLVLPAQMHWEVVRGMTQNVKSGEGHTSHENLCIEL